jgi:acetyltransferase-like isoleucine patch superfamily enzyme
MNSDKNFRIIVLEILGPWVQRLRFLALRFKGYRNISQLATIERNVNLDRVYPASIYIGPGSLIASSATLLCHEHVYRELGNPELPLHKPVRIGSRCFIGVSAVVLPGVTIGDDCIIGAGSIVAKDIPAGSLAVGNPARIIRSGLRLNERAIIENT